MGRWRLPEGDTVFLAGKRLHDALAGATLTRGELRHPRLVQHDLAGRTVLEVVSVGKHLFTRFDDDTSLHSHLRMDGTWHLYRRAAPAWRRRPPNPGDPPKVPERGGPWATGCTTSTCCRLRTKNLGATSAPTCRRRLGRDSSAEAERRLRADPARAVGAALLTRG